MTFCSDRQRDRAVLGLHILIFLCCLALFAACNRMSTTRNARLVKVADAKATEGDFLRAIALYESALDDLDSAAEIHYRLALLYDDKMNEPLNALHHFKRYLTLAPTGGHASDAKNFMKRDELALLTNLSGDTVVPRTEAARLRNENLALRKQLEDQRVLVQRAGIATKKTAAEQPRSDKITETKSGSPRRTYVVQKGDTLASIARKFYKSSARWKEIRDANANKIDNPQDLKIGETLTIP
jgi:tetratricopeptide (TPR) repeat protein